MVLLNQDAEALLSEMLGNVVPLKALPDAAVNVTEALAKSRGVELPTMSSVKPVEVTLILTEVITGARRGITIPALGLGVGSANPTVRPPRTSVSFVSVTVMVPATLPTWMASVGGRVALLLP